jgi:hypothetical protein
VGEKLIMVWWMTCFVAHKFVPTRICVTYVVAHGHSPIGHIHHGVASTSMKVIFQFHLLPEHSLLC